MVGVLHLLERVELLGQLKDLLVGLHKTVLLELNALVGKNPGHVSDLLLAAPVQSKDLALVGAELVLGAANHSEVGVCLLVDSDWHLQLGKLREVSRVLHLL